MIIPIGVIKQNNLSTTFLKYNRGTEGEHNELRRESHLNFIYFVTTGSHNCAWVYTIMRINLPLNTVPYA